MLTSDSHVVIPHMMVVLKEPLHVVTLLSDAMGRVRVVGGGVVFTAARKHKRKQEDFKAPYGFFGIRSVFRGAVWSALKTMLWTRKKDSIRAYVCNPFKGSSTNASGLHFPNVARLTE